MSIAHGTLKPVLYIGFRGISCRMLTFIGLFRDFQVHQFERPRFAFLQSGKYSIKHQINDYTQLAMIKVMALRWIRSANFVASNRSCLCWNEVCIARLSRLTHWGWLFSLASSLKFILPKDPVQFSPLCLHTTRPHFDQTTPPYPDLIIASVILHRILFLIAERFSDLSAFSALQRDAHISLRVSLTQIAIMGWYPSDGSYRHYNTDSGWHQ